MVDVGARRSPMSTPPSRHRVDRPNGGPTVHPTDPSQTQRRTLGAVIATVALAVGLLAGCSDDGGGSASTDATTGTTATPAVGVDYSARGPYEVGFTTLDVDGTEVYVVYPGDDEAVADGASEHVTSISSDIAFPESFREIAPDFFIQELTTDHHVDVLASGEGPFPVVLSSHGFSGHPAYVISHLEHLASWGYVVLAPSHPSRNLEASILGTVDREGDPDVDDLTGALDAIAEHNADQDSPLYAAVDTQRVAAEGHSAGGGAIGRLALRDDRLTTLIGQAPGAPVAVERDESMSEADRLTALDQALATIDPPDLPVLLIAGERDGVIPLASVEAQYRWLETPKQLVVVANAGHNPFLDICANLQDQGGLVANAGDLAETFGDLLLLGEDGCLDDYLDAEVGTAMLDHLSVAWLRWAFGQDTNDAAISPDFLEATFPEATGVVEQDL